MVSLPDKVLNTIRSHGMISAGDRIIVGVSGGPDSVCLLRILHELAEELRYAELCVLHVNHGLRGADSDGDEQFTRALTEELGVPFECVRQDVAKLAERAGTGLENAGRQVRYEAFEECRQRRGAQRIAVAHNRGDQAETILMRVLRGTGIHGLRGMDPVSQKGVLIRPLLEADREEIEACCREHGWNFRIDSTNLQPVYTRNRVRLDLIPKMEQEYNPKLRDALVRLGRQAAEADAALEETALRFLEGTLSGGNRRWSEKECALVLDGFEELPPAAAKKVLQICLEKTSFSEDLTTAILEQLYSAATGPEPAEADAGNGRYVLKTYGKLWFLRRSEQKQPISGTVDLPAENLEKTGIQVIRAGNTDVVLQLITVNDNIRRTETVRKRVMKGIDVVSDSAELAEDGSGTESGVTSAGQHYKINAALDWDKVKQTGVPVIRNRRPGDRIRPIGMTGSKKLQDYFVDRKIPRHLRDSFLLLAAGGRILLAGSETAADCAVTKETERILLVQY